MTSRLATFAINGATKYGAVTDSGIIDLSARYSGDYPTLREAIEHGALQRLADAAENQPADFALDDVTFRPPIPSPEKIICVGVN